MPVIYTPQQVESVVSFAPAGLVLQPFIIGNAVRSPSGVKLPHVVLQHTIHFPMQSLVTVI